MKNIPDIQGAKRGYRMTARAEAAQAAGDRILDAFTDRLRDGWFDEIRLDDVAQAAGVSVQTVIRRFGGKDGLLEAAQERLDREVRARRIMPARGVAAAVSAVLADYEEGGDLIIRALAQEERHPAIRKTTDYGRAGHRGWLSEVFASDLAARPVSEAEACLDALVVATDVYVWKLMRRDMRRPLRDVQALMERMVRTALADPDPANPRGCS